MSDIWGGGREYINTLKQREEPYYDRLDKKIYVAERINSGIRKESQTYFCGDRHLSAIADGGTPSE